jgi:TolB-like protein
MLTIVRFDRYEVDVSAGQIRKRGVRIRLSGQPFQVLAALLETPGQVVTREDLRRRLWPGEVFVDFDNGVNTAIARIREALCDSADAPRFIETLPKHGYRFIAAVSGPTPTADPAVQRRARLVVLPFLNLSGDPAQEYFSDAMTDETITALAKLAPASLAVLARTTTMHYKGTHKDVTRISRELAVDFIVEGSVRCTDSRVALNLQLIRVSDQAHVWAHRYDTELGDVFGAQTAIAQAIAAQLGVASPTAAPCAARPIRKPTEDLEAYTLYRQGRHHLSIQTPEHFAAAKRCFEQAVARDPQFALAYDALADLFWYFGFFGYAPPNDVVGPGMSYVLRALDIDNALAETHALLGHYRWQLDFNWAEVKLQLGRARELNPLSPLVRVRYAMGPLLTERRMEEAVAEIEAALESDPLSVFLRAWLGCMLWLDRQYDRAIEQGRLMVEIEPANYVGYWHLGMYSRDKGLFDESIAAHRRAVELSGGSMLMLGWLGLALGQSGNTAEARGVLERLHAAAAQMYVPPTSFAWTYFGLGDIDNAFVSLDRAIDARDHMIIPIQTYPFLDPVRDDPRYTALLRKMKLDA